VEVDEPAFQMYNNPICDGIQNHKLIVVYVKNKENVEPIIIQPYIFGYNEKRELLLQGNRVTQVDLKDFGSKNEKDQGYFGGILSTFKGSDWTDITIDKVLDIQVLEESSFTPEQKIVDKLQKKSKIVEPLCVIQY
jgi:hypothetical protein